MRIESATRACARARVLVPGGHSASEPPAELQHKAFVLLMFPTYLLAIFCVLHSFVVDPDICVVGDYFVSVFYVLTSFYFALQLTALLRYNSHII